MPHTLIATDYKISRLVYPNSVNELKVLFIYGTNFKREMNIFYIPPAVQIAAALVLSFIFVAAITLFMIRRKLRVLSNDLFSAITDCWIPFIGGGSLRMEHRLERLFFAILLFGAFFIMSVLSGDLFDCVVSVLNAKVNTFEKLAQINPPIYSFYELHLNEDVIRQQLM